MNSKVKAQYKIIYNSGIEQIKNLISHDDYVNIIKPSQEKIYLLEIDQQNKEENKRKISAIKKELRGMFGEEYFTDKSPYFEAIESDVLNLLPQQGGNHKIQLIKL